MFIVYLQTEGSSAAEPGAGKPFWPNEVRLLAQFIEISVVKTVPVILWRIPSSSLSATTNTPTVRKGFKFGVGHFTTKTTHAQ